MKKYIFLALSVLLMAPANASAECRKAKVTEPTQSTHGDFGYCFGAYYKGEYSCMYIPENDATICWTPRHELPDFLIAWDGQEGHMFYPNKEHFAKVRDKGNGQLFIYWDEGQVDTCLLVKTTAQWCD